MGNQRVRLNPQQRAFASNYAVTGDPVYSATKAGYNKSPAPRASQNLALPHVQAEIARIQSEKLFNEALPAAVNCLISIISSDKAPAGARVQAAKVVLDRTLGAEDAGKGKEPHEMTPEELATAISALERAAADKAKPVKPNKADVADIEDAEIVPEGSIFD